MSLLPYTGQGVSCQDYLGMRDGDIFDNHITSSPYVSAPKHARLSATVGWRPKTLAGSWLEVNLLRQTFVTGVITLGRHGYHYFVTKYRVTTSLDGSQWYNVTDENGEIEVKYYKRTNTIS